MSTDEPQRYEPQTARARGERAGGRGTGGGDAGPAVVRRWVAVVVALATLVIGGVLGYFAAGGPDPPTQLQVVTDLPAVTVTVPK